MKIGICASPKKANSPTYIGPIVSLLRKAGAEVFIDNEVTNDHNLPLIDRSVPIDVIITLGGDGTLLYYRRKYEELPSVAFTAINLGGLGFMADVQVNEIDAYLRDLAQGKYTIEERIILEGKKPDGSLLTAANDFVLHRSSNPSMILLKVTINGDHFNTFQADGLIVSTPTGSSGYSLACGGPLMHPRLKAFVLTTISAHTLTNRPFVIPDDSAIRVEYISDSDKSIDVTVDGIDSFPIKNGNIVELFAAKKPFRIIHYNRHNFYETVRHKLHWKGTSILC